MKNQKINNAIGTQLKLARKEKGWSLDVACQFTGVSKAMLGQIERGESSPTVAKLWDIANGFKLPLSYFLAVVSKDTVSKDPLSKDSVNIVEVTNPDLTVVTDEGLSISTLFPFDKTTNIEVFSLCLFPNYQHISLPHNDGVIEHILVVEGEMEYFLDGKWHSLYQGEVVKFNADKQHGYRNSSKSPSTFHNIICYPSAL